MTTTVGEMIAMLQQFDPELPLLVDGYEGGYDDPQKPFLSFAHERGYESYSGKYGDDYNPYLSLSLEEQKREHLASDWIEDHEKQIFDCVVIAR